MSTTQEASPATRGEIRERTITEAKCPVEGHGWHELSPEFWYRNRESGELYIGISSGCKQHVRERRRRETNGSKS